MAKWSLVLGVGGFVALLLVAPMPSNAAATTVPVCTPGQLAVTVSAWTYNPSTAGSVFQTLPISITNEGATCVIGGLPKIVPIGIKVARKPSGEVVTTLVEGATVNSMKYKLLTLTKGQAAHTYLNLVHPIGNATTVRKWTNACRPAAATGFTIDVVPAKKLLNRHVKVTIPKVCTTGKANDLSTGPLVGTAG